LKVSDVPRYEDVVFAVKRAYADWRSERFELRDLALVAFLAFTGCRLEEALGLGVFQLTFVAVGAGFQALKSPRVSRLEGSRG